MFRVEQLRNDTLNSFRYSGVSLKYRFLFLPNMGYFFTNTLDITTSSLSLDYINPKNKKRLDFIMKLHKDGMTNKQIVEILKSKKIKRRNKNDFYSVKDVWVCIKKLKERNLRKSNIKEILGDWEIWKYDYEKSE